MSYKRIKGILLYVEQRGSGYNRKHGDKGEVMQEIWIIFHQSVYAKEARRTIIFSLFSDVFARCPDLVFYGSVFIFLTDRTETL